ncbi:MAG: hypothetical protein U9Q71_06765 [Pseudomonadota bacterium]|nr:hypothetical protein [Pseudomonadota bacterium]
MHKRCYPAAAMLALCLSGTAMALGPVDGEVGLQWWNTQFDADILDGELDVGTWSGFGELWLDQKWGLRGAFYQSDLEHEDLDNEQRFNIDLKRRLLSPTDNTFLALGAGWESIDLSSGGRSDGVRLVLEGRVGLAGFVYLYGQNAWIPWLSESDGLSDLSGNEFEVGIGFEPLPFLSLRAGYRDFRLDYDYDTRDGSESSRSKGLLLGAGVHW